jgi:hypothetical protein
MKNVSLPPKWHPIPFIVHNFRPSEQYLKKNVQWQPTGELPCSGAEWQIWPCQLGYSIQQPFGYWPNALTTRRPWDAYKALQVLLKGKRNNDTHFFNLIDLFSSKPLNVVLNYFALSALKLGSIVCFNVTLKLFVYKIICVQITNNCSEYASEGWSGQIFVKDSIDFDFFPQTIIDSLMWICFSLAEEVRLEDLVKECNQFSVGSNTTVKQILEELS